MKSIKDLFQNIPHIRSIKGVENSAESDLTHTESTSLPKDISSIVPELDEGQLTVFPLTASPETTGEEINEPPSTAAEGTRTYLQESSASTQNKGLIKDLISLIVEFDAILGNDLNDDSQRIIEMCQYRLIESLLNNGLSPIDKDVLFDHSLHVPIPYSLVQDGTAIKEIKRIGLRDDKVIYLKAQVLL